MNKYLVFVSNKKTLIGILVLVSILISLQRYFVPNTDLGWTGYNNFIIFKQSFFHLIESKDLYTFFPNEHFDLFKYSPTFALLIGFVSYLHNLPGLIIWNTLNVLIFFYAFWKLPFTNKKFKLFGLLFVLIELITSTQNSQCNAMIVGVIAWAYLALENKKVGLATLLIVSTMFIKLFGIVALVMLLFYPNKIKSTLYTLLWFVILGLLPLFVISINQLGFLYDSWLKLLLFDAGDKMKFSVMGILQSWFGMSASYKGIVLLIGMAMFCIPLLKIKSYSIPRFKILFLSSVLIWVIIFNHMAESATFVIAVAGVAIWYFTKNKPSRLDTFLLLLTLLLTILSPTDLFPRSLRDGFFIPYTLKVLPVILIWIKINVELMMIKKVSLTQ